MNKIALTLLLCLLIGACAGYRTYPNCRGYDGFGYYQMGCGCGCPNQMMPCQQMPMAAQGAQIFEVQAPYIEAPTVYTVQDKNVIIKEKSPYSVTYEYQDIRLDKIADYAGEYCAMTGAKARMRESLTHRNNSRLATFDCLAK